MIVMMMVTSDDDDDDVKQSTKICNFNFSHVYEFT